MSITSLDELEGMRRAGRVVADALAAGRRAVAPGVTPAEIDEVCAAVFRRHHAVSEPQAVYDAPCAVFVSVNEAIVHGLPDRRRLQPGDVVKIDVTPMVDGFIADGAIDRAVGCGATRRDQAGGGWVDVCNGRWEPDRDHEHTIVVMNGAPFVLTA
ncbi:MAG: M24 family metallopeptidase [Vicinamibacterales bacterium]